MFFCSPKAKQGYRPLLMVYRILRLMARGREFQENQDYGVQ